MTDQPLVREKMSPPTETIQASTPLIAARQRMQGQMSVKSLIVVENERPVGLLRYTDIGRDSAPEATIRDLMVAEVPSAREDQSLNELSGVMTEYDIDRLAVVDASGVLIGELPRAALTLSETATGEAGMAAQTLPGTMSGQTSPAFDIRNDMTVVGSQGGKIGTVKEVLSDSLTGALTHIVVHTGLIFGKDRSVPADLVDTVEGDQVCLKVDKAEIDMLPDLNAAS